MRALVVVANVLAFASLAVSLAGCAEDTPPKCSLNQKVTGKFVIGAPTKPVTADLMVQGTVDAPNDVTIYSVDINSIPATSNAGSNFASWSATVPWALLMQQADASGKVMLAAHATTNCGSDPIDLAMISVSLDVPPAGIKVSDLDMVATLPNGQSYLPATKPGSALVTITAAPAGSGAVVALTATGGTVTPAQVTLSSDGMAKASAMALLSSTTPGIAAVTASSMGQTKLITVPVAGPPVLAPSSVILALGSTIRVTVLTDGKVDSCQALPSPGLTVVSGAQNLMAAPGGTDVTGDQRIDIDITAGQTITTPMQTTISCRDPFGQTGTSTFSGPPAP